MTSRMVDISSTIECPKIVASPANMDKNEINGERKREGVPVGGKRPVSMPIVVVLPAPLWPNKQKSCPNSEINRTKKRTPLNN